MKILCTGDIHAYQFTDFSKNLMVVWDDEILRYCDITGSDGTDRWYEEHWDVEAKELSSRFFNILNALCDMRDYCVKNKINHVLIAGDLFHKRGTIEVVVFNAIYKVLDSFYDVGIAVHLIAGNHDQVDASVIPTSSIHSFKDIAHIIEKPERFWIQDEDLSNTVETLEPEEGDVEIVAIPYSKDKSFVLKSMEELREQCVDPERAILLCHVGITGGTVGSGMYSIKDEYSLKDLKSSHWKYLVAGHYHQPQLLDYNAIYTGTPVQNSFGDELKGKDGYNGFFVIDTDKRYDIQFVPIIAPRFITVSSADELEQYDSDYIKSNYFRIKSAAKDVEEIKDTLSDILGDDDQEVRLELEKDYTTEQRSEIVVSQSFEETVQIYAQERCEDKKLVDKYAALGLEILSEALVGGK